MHTERFLTEDMRDNVDVLINAVVACWYSREEAKLGYAVITSQALTVGGSHIPSLRPLPYNTGTALPFQDMQVFRTGL